ncbi:phosphotransferase [Leucobacter allii]|uniref:phosphotransferase n=1 Tax=Leucobacter allii TaxID=2932247 RepID=UPI001FD0F286|nr:phosphotransferase [Leucobacter allii]UOR00328.1 phosphotransferase [Leucobacter allii]
MASIPFTLAALATSAVPGLVVSGVRGHDGEEGFSSAILAGEDAELLVRVPRTQAAEVQQSAELLGLAALTDGPRDRLPFAVPRTLGMTRAGDTRAVVSTAIDGERFAVEDLADDALLLQPIAEAIAAIHELPHTVALQGGLPTRSAQDLRLRATRVIDRAERTRLLPETILRRWQQAVESAELWDFSPTMVHGSLDAEQLRVAEDRVVGVLGWSELSIGDPASDLCWLLGAGPEVLEGVLVRYGAARNAGSSGTLRTRAALYHELEVARWLLHGVEVHDASVVDDAVAMLDRMVGVTGPLGAAMLAQVARPPLGEHEAIALLDEVPDVPDAVDHRSDTAAFEALDEDRMFGVDTDFIEPLPDEDATPAEAGTADAAADTDAAEAAGSADLTGVVEPSDAAGLSGAADLSDAADLSGAADLAQVPDAQDTAYTSDASFRAATAADVPESDIPESEQLTEPISDDELPAPRKRIPAFLRLRPEDEAGPTGR